MATIKSFTSLEQSKKLAKVLPIESADMYWWYSGKRYYIEAMDDGDFNEEGDTRAWSLAALLDFMKDKIIFGGNSPEGWFCCYTIQNPTKTLTIYKDSLVDACYEMILKLNELKIL